MRQHNNVRRGIAKPLKAGGRDPKQFDILYRDARSQWKACYHLPMRMRDLVIAATAMIHGSRFHRRLVAEAGGDSQSAAGAD